MRANYPTELKLRISHRIVIGLNQAPPTRGTRVHPRNSHAHTSLTHPSPRTLSLFFLIGILYRFVLLASPAKQKTISHTMYTDAVAPSARSYTRKPVMKCGELDSLLTPDRIQEFSAGCHVRDHGREGQGAKGQSPRSSSIDCHFRVKSNR